MVGRCYWLNSARLSGSSSVVFGRRVGRRHRWRTGPPSRVDEQARTSKAPVISETLMSLVLIHFAGRMRTAPEGREVSRVREAEGRQGLLSLPELFVSATRGLVVVLPVGRVPEANVVLALPAFLR